MIADETFEFWLYKASQYDTGSGSFVGDPLAKAKTVNGIAVFREDNGTPVYKDDDFVFEPDEEYVVWEVPMEGWVYGPQGAYMTVEIFDSLPEVGFADNKFYNTPLGSISGYKYRRVTDDECVEPDPINDIPLEGYPIGLYVDGKLEYVATTDENGYFEFPNLKLGSYKVVDPTNDYWKAVEGFDTEVNVTLTAAEPNNHSVVFKNYLVNVGTDVYCGYGEDAEPVYGGKWYTYVTLDAGKVTEKYSLQAGDPDVAGKNIVGTFTATIDGDNLIIKVDLDLTEYSYGLKNGEPEINVGVSNSTSFFSGDVQGNSYLNATGFRDRITDTTKFIIPLDELKLEAGEAINIFVNGVVVNVPEGYEKIFPELLSELP